MSATAAAELPERLVSVRQVFGIDTNLVVRGFAQPSEQVPAIDETYRFDPDVTLALLAGFSRNRRVLVHGLHGTGKTTHVEQVAARLNWPCLRVNLDGHVSRMDLIGRDAVVAHDGLQVTEFQEGVVPWALQRPVALVLDEYDAGRPEVMFVIQQLLERDGKLTLLDRNAVLHPHPAFRIFATANTVGQGNLNGLYHGVQRLNHAQLDRWDIVAHLDYLPTDEEIAIVSAHAPELNASRELIAAMVALAQLTREGFAAGDISTLMSPRTLITWAENIEVFGDVAQAFRLSFLNRCPEPEHQVIAEYYQRCFAAELAESLDAASARV
ncbi:MAG: AAA family ATPase [Mycobacteriales bacterium]